MGENLNELVEVERGTYEFKSDGVPLTEEEDLQFFNEHTDGLLNLVILAHEEVLSNDGFNYIMNHRKKTSNG